MDLPQVVPVLVLVLVLLGVVLCLYAVPLRIRMRTEFATGVRRASMSVTWLCLGIRGTLNNGTRGFQVLLGNHALPLPFIGRDRLAGDLRRGCPDRSGQETGSVPALIRSAVPLIPEILSFLRSLSQSFSFDLLECQAVVGLCGPAETGMLYGYFWALKSIFCSSRRFHLEMVPDFTRERLEGHLDLEGSIRYPFTLLVRGMVLFFRFRRPFRAGTGGGTWGDGYP